MRAYASCGVTRLIIHGLLLGAESLLFWERVFWLAVSRNNSSTTSVTDFEKTELSTLNVCDHPHGAGTRVLAFGSVGGQNSVALGFA